MPTLTVTYGQPTDPQAFDHHYETVHTPLAAKVPHIVRFTARRCHAPDGDPGPVYLIAQIEFATDADLESALKSPEGQAAAADISGFATGGANLFIQV